MSTSPPSSSDAILVWDWPTRVFHWCLVLCFAGAWLTSESERLHLVHITLGYTMAGLVAFRVVWGLVGSRHARFASFVRSPLAAWAYLKNLMAGRPDHHVGHNPAGGLAVVGLLALAAGVTLSGWLNDSGDAPHWLEELHEVLASGMLALVAVHVLGVVVGSLAHKENLARAMVTGFKRGPADQAIGRSRLIVGVLLLAAVLAGWAWQWQHAPQRNAPESAAAQGGNAPPAERARRRDDDHD